MDSPNLAPEPEVDLSQNIESDRTKGRVMAIIGLLLMLVPLFGFIWAVYRVVSVFQMPGSQDPEAFEGGSIAAFTTIAWTMGWGLITGGPGIILVLVAVLKQGNRERWFYRAAVIVSVIWWFLFFPMGVLIGGYLLFIFRSRKSEFQTLRVNPHGDVA